MTTQASTTYEEIRAAHRWDIPEYYNIAADVCDRQAELRRDDLAYFIEKDDCIQKVTYGLLQQRANALAHIFTDLGLKRGDRVAIVLPLDNAVPATHIACWKMGLISCPMAALFGADALAFRFTNAEISAVVTDQARLPAVLQAAAAAPSLRHIFLVDGEAKGTLNFWGLTATAPTTFETVQTKAEDPAYLCYTSGTTGQPKGALAAHRALLGQVPSTQFVSGYAPAGEIQFFPADWSWAAGLTSLTTGLRAGRVLAVKAKLGFDPLDTFRFLSEHKVGVATLLATMLRMMRAVPKEERDRYPLRLHTVTTGAEAVGADLYRFVEQEIGARLSEAFGQTECNMCLVNNSRYMAPRPGSLGKVAPGFEVDIVDEAGNPQPVGTVGQIGVREGNPITMLGYWRNPEATKRKYANGWLLTGDLGQKDQEGYYWYVGRVDDVITSSGYRIGPGEIEDSLVSHPAVGLAAAIGVPDPVRTEFIKAFVTLKPGFAPSDALADEIRAYVRERLAKHEVPREIEFVTEMPTTTTGKIMRRALKERELERRAHIARASA